MHTATSQYAIRETKLFEGLLAGFWPAMKLYCQEADDATSSHPREQFSLSVFCTSLEKPNNDTIHRQHPMPKTERTKCAYMRQSN